MDQVKLYMILIGCKPAGRNTEQHDIFFGIGPSPKALVPDMIDAWPEAKGRIHIDAWREVNQVGGYTIKVTTRESPVSGSLKIYFLNLGGYKQGEFEEFHYKLLSVAPDKGIAVGEAKQTAFYKHSGFKGADSHIDDKYGIDVDDIHEIEDILPPGIKDRYRILITPTASAASDEIHIGYFKLNALP